MTDAAVVPLDEIQWNSPQAIAFYGGISAENVHLYFMNSPFCERTSNNKILESQSQFNQQLNDDLRDRARMEARLERMNGVEYRVVDGPLHTTPEMNPVWVFRKQNREKHAGQDDKLTILGTYFAIGENIYQAPSLHDIVRCRMMSVTNLLSKFYDTAASMQFYYPSQGHSYLPSVPKPSARPGLESTRTSRTNSPIPDTASQGHSLSQQSAKNTQEANDDRAIWESFNLSAQYGSEFMDENPLVGEPGSFVLASTARNLSDKRAKETAAEAAIKTSQDAISRSVSVAPTPPVSAKPVEPMRKVSTSAKAKSPTSAVADGGVKKRRKSKAPGTPGVASPV